MIIAGISSADNNSLALAGPGAAGFGLMKIQKSGSNCLNLGTTSYYHNITIIFIVFAYYKVNVKKQIKNFIY